MSVPSHEHRYEYTRALNETMPLSTLAENNRQQKDSVLHATGFQCVFFWFLVFFFFFFFVFWFFSFSFLGSSYDTYVENSNFPLTIQDKRSERAALRSENELCRIKFKVFGQHKGHSGNPFVSCYLDWRCSPLQSEIFPPIFMVPQRGEQLLRVATTQHNTIQHKQHKPQSENRGPPWRHEAPAM